jgi:multidrug efflux pump subunit AcrB
MVIAPRAREASVQISLQFDRSRTVDSAAQDVRAAINSTAGRQTRHGLKNPGRRTGREFPRQSSSSSVNPTLRVTW